MKLYNHGHDQKSWWVPWFLIKAGVWVIRTLGLRGQEQWTGQTGPLGTPPDSAADTDPGFGAVLALLVLG